MVVKKVYESIQWIPITEKEPDTSDHILVTVRWGEDDYEVMELDYWVTKEFPTDLGERVLKHITAWCPLPEPYME